MASIVAQRVHIGALADVTSNLNIPQVKPTGKSRKVRFVPTTRITSPSIIRTKGIKYKPTVTEDNYRNILESPDPVALLSIDNGHVAVAPEAIAPPSPNMGKKRNKSVSSSRSATPTPSTPPVAKTGSEQLITIDESGVAMAKATPPITPKVYNGSPLDKELPPRPILRADGSPERRGLLDATDSDSSLHTHPALQPASTGGYSPSSNGSFKVASSLGTPSTLDSEFEVGEGVTIPGKVVHSVTSMNLEKAKVITAVPVRASDKIATPAQRVQGLSSQPSNSSLKNRQSRTGVSLNIRKSADAHELIMGSDASPASTGSPHPPRISSLPKAVKSTGQLSAASRLSRPTAASAARAAESKKTMVNPSKTPGKSFLNRTSASKVSILSSANKSITSTNLSNKPGPGANESSASIPKSNTAASISKGLRSRISGIFSSKRRATVASAGSKGYNIIDEEDATADISDPDSPTINRRASKLLTTYRNSGMKTKASSDNIRGDKKTPFMGKTADREPSAREQRLQEREESRVNRAAEGIACGGQNGITRGTARVDRGDDSPPTPPPTRDGPASHYGEGENAECGADEMTEEEFDRYLEVQLNGAEQDLTAAIRAAQRMAGAEEAVTRVIDVLGNAIIAARQAHIAGIQLRVATADLINITTQRAAGARQAIADAAFVARCGN